MRLHELLTLPLLASLGCGSAPAPSAPAPQYLSLNGNWEAIGLPSTSGPLLTTPIADFTGALQSTGGAVTGTLRAFDASNFLTPCVPLTQDLTATGTLSSSGNLALTVPISGGTATFTATLGSNLQSFTMGTWQILGGPCAMPATSMAFTQFASLTGAYTGTLSSYGTTNNSTSITAMLTQSSTPDADGRFPLTGTIAATGACTGTYPLAPETVSGNGVTPSNSGLLMPVATISGPFPPTAALIQSAVVEIYSANCSAGVLVGTLTRQ